MNILYIDIDSLRQTTWDVMVTIAIRLQISIKLQEAGLRFNNCYTSDAPCFTSRTAMTTGKLGIHAGW